MENRVWEEGGQWGRWASENWPSCAQRTSVLSAVMSVGSKHTSCNELKCQGARLEEETQISSLLKPAGGGNGKGTCGGKNRNEGSEAGLSSEPTPRTTAWRTSVSVWEAGAGTSPLPSSHLVAVDGDLDRHIQGLVGHPTHCLQQGHENQGEPHEEDQSQHGDASNPVLHGFLLLPPKRPGVFLQKGGSRSGPGRYRLNGGQVGE